MQTPTMNHAAHVVNINDKMQNRIIQMANEKISETKVLIEKLMPQFEEKKLQLKMAQDEFDNVSKQIESMRADIERDATIIRTMRHFTDIQSDKELRVVGYETKPTTEGFKSPKKVNWLQAISDILNKENRFMTFPEIWYLLGEDSDLVAAANKTGVGFKKSRGSVSGNLQRHAELKGSTRGQYVIMYKDKFGLPEWLDKSGTILPKFLKEFMHNEPDYKHIENLKAV